jgi:diguanylate cyclase (GGDEF)-like protein
VEKEEIFGFILKIREEVLKKLDSTGTPSYPKYYEKLFRDLILKAENPEVVKLYQRYSEDGSKDNSDEELEKYMGISKKSLDAFSSSNKTISKTVMAQGDYLDSIKLDDVDNARVNYQKIMNSMLSFQSQLLDELRRSDEQIRRLEGELEQALNESKIDPLTKLFNKRAFISDMESVMTSGQGKPLNMSFLYIDVDNFGCVNNDFGHLAGDKVLIFLANTFKNSIRDGDKLYRYGDEEFVLVLNRLAPEKSIEIAERIKSKVEISKLIYSEQILKVTISMGVTHHKVGDSLEGMLARSVEALKDAKNEGKNLVKEKL